MTFAIGRRAATSTVARHFARNAIRANSSLTPGKSHTVLDRKPSEVRYFRFARYINILIYILLIYF